MARLILAALKQSGRPLSTHVLAQQVMAERGPNTADKRLVGIIGKRVGSAARHLRSWGRSGRRKDRAVLGVGSDAVLAWENEP